MSATCVAPVRLDIRPSAARRWLPLIYSIEQVVAAVLLVGLAPLLVAAALIIAVLSRRSPLIAHLRLGRDAKPLWVVKYRTMWAAEKMTSTGWSLLEYIAESPRTLKSAMDARVTSRFARFCRRYSIDELPQLINVARGEMSFVGPRPVTAAEMREHYGPHSTEVLSAKPGLTGLWQTMGRSRLSYAQRVRLDLFLVRRCCVRLYLRVLWRTIPRVLGGTDAW